MRTSTLRRFTFSKLAITVAVLFVTYLAVGYLALPAIVKWQIERQVQELGHKVTVGDVRFDPLSYVFEADDLALSDVDDGALLGFKRMRLDFELRSVIDRAWTFAEATLEAPVLRFDLARDGRHNFAGILDRLRGDVSGDLDDPKFDYGEVIAKAFTNMLGKIVTAPFKALGALFGAGDRKLDTIDFDPGSDVIAPPEREKLEAVARALNERPALLLVVPPTYAPAEDTPVLQSLAVRTDIAKRMGIALPAGDDPGPIDAANPRAQRAIEGVFGQHYAPGVLAELKREASGAAKQVASSPAAPPETGSAGTGGSKEATKASPPAPKPPAPSPSPAFYEGLLERMIDEAHITEPMLTGLANRRGEAIVRELTSVGGVPAAQVTLGERRKATDTDANAVALRLELGVAE